MAEQYNNQKINVHGERITRLETRADNHDIMHNDTKNILKEVQKDLKWQTKQIFMGLGGLTVILIVVDLIFRGLPK